MDGALYIADWQANRINRYDAATGALLGTFAEGGGLEAPNSTRVREATGVGVTLAHHGGLVP